MSTSTSKPLLLSSSGKDAGTHKLTLFRYIIMHPNAMQLPYVNQAAHTRKLNATYNITFADLSQSQATEIKKLLDPVNGSIQLNKAHQIKMPIDIKPTTEEVSTERVRRISPYPKAPVTCPKITIGKNFVLFFPDSFVDKSKFPNVNLTIGTNYSGWPTPCNPHANYTLSTFEQVLGDPNMPVVNIPAFTCGGIITDEVSIKAMLDILAYKQANPTKNVAMYYAVGPALPNDILTKVTKELVTAGILAGFSAGNAGMNICNANFPPHNVRGTLQIGATQPPGNQCPWWSNWSDVVLNNQYGDCVNAYLPGVFTSKQFGVEIKGTSFAIPQALAWALRWWNNNPTATATDVINAFNNHTVTITKANPNARPPQPPFTPTGKMRVVKTIDYCNTNVSSKPKP